jgi:hypothetical protein
VAVELGDVVAVAQVLSVYRCTSSPPVSVLPASFATGELDRDREERTERERGGRNCFIDICGPQDFLYFSFF